MKPIEKLDVADLAVLDAATIVSFSSQMSPGFRRLLRATAGVILAACSASPARLNAQLSGGGGVHQSNPEAAARLAQFDKTNGEYEALRRISPMQKFFDGFTFGLTTSQWERDIKRAIQDDIASRRVVTVEELRQVGAVGESDNLSLYPAATTGAQEIALNAGRLAAISLVFFCIVSYRRQERRPRDTQKAKTTGTSSKK